MAIYKYIARVIQNQLQSQLGLANISQSQPALARVSQNQLEFIVPISSPYLLSAGYRVEPNCIDRYRSQLRRSLTANLEWSALSTINMTARQATKQLLQSFLSFSCPPMSHIVNLSPGWFIFIHGRIKLKGLYPLWAARIGYNCDNINNDESLYLLRKMNTNIPVLYLI